MKFERFIRTLFERLNAHPTDALRDDTSYDFIIEPENSLELVPVEVKRYPTLRIAHSVVRKSFDALEIAMRNRNFRRALFVTNSRIPPSLRAEGKSRNIVVYDYDLISEIIRFTPELSEEWERVTQEGFLYRSEAIPTGEQVKTPILPT